eukprot:NODE_371_length_8592_cov_0.668904.p5 type:complete len:128 gc:universal NODE_371_length_8592_cov_0.668904:8112-8495(+)
MGFFENSMGNLKTGRTTGLAKTCALIGFGFALAAIILGFIFGSIGYSIAGLIVLIIGLFMEFGMNRIEQTEKYRDIIRSIWYLISAIIYFSLPAVWNGLYIVGGIFHLLTCIFYIVGWKFGGTTSNV